MVQDVSYKNDNGNDETYATTFGILANYYYECGSDMRDRYELAMTNDYTKGIYRS